MNPRKRQWPDLMRYKQPELKILFFIESLRSGGKERRLHQLIDYLVNKKNHRVMLVLMSDEVHYKEIYDHDLSIKVLKRKYGKKDPLVFLSFCKLVREFKPDIIHTWGIMNTFYAIPVRLLLRVPLVNSIITNVEPGYESGSLTHFFARLSFRYSDMTLANSYAGVEAYGVGGQKVKVVHNGINLERFERAIEDEDFRNHLKLKGLLVITMVASINEKKNHNLLLDLAKEIGTKRENVRFLIVGDGPMRGIIEQRLADEQIDNVLLLGTRSDVEVITKSTDIGVLLTYNEGFPNSVMEFMASGKPVMVSDAGGSKELVAHEKVGFLIKNDQFEDIVTKLTTLIDDIGMRKRMGESGLKLIKEQFLIEKMSEAHLDVYKQLI